MIWHNFYNITSAGSVLGRTGAQDTLETSLTGTEVLSVTDADGNHQQTDFIMNDPEKELSWVEIKGKWLCTLWQLVFGIIRG